MGIFQTPVNAPWHVRKKMKAGAVLSPLSAAPLEGAWHGVRGRHSALSFFLALYYPMEIAPLRECLQQNRNDVCVWE